MIAGGLAAAAGRRRRAAAPTPRAPARQAAAAENGWVTSTLARMTLEEKVGQLFIQNVYGKRRHDARQPQPAALRRREPGRGRAEVPPRWGHLLRVDRQRAEPRPDRRPVQRPAAVGPDAAVEGAACRCRSPSTRSRASSPASDRPRRSSPGRWPSAPAAAPRTRAPPPRSPAASCSRWASTPNFAPVCDVNVNPLNPVIGTRSFSSHPDLAAELVAAQVAGYQRDGGVSSSAKHFPGPRRHRDRQPRRLPGHHAHARAVGVDRRAALPGRDQRADRHDHDRAPGLPGPRRLGQPRHPEQADHDRRAARGARLRRRHRHRLPCHARRARPLRRRRGGGARPPRRRRPAAHDARHGRRVCRRARRRAQRPHPARRARHEGASRAAPQVPPRHRGPPVRRPGRASRPSSALPPTSPRPTSVTDRTTTLVKNDDKALPIAPSGKKVLVTGYGVVDDGDARGRPDRQGRDGPDRPDRHVAHRRAGRPPPSPPPPTRTSSSSRR